MKKTRFWKLKQITGIFLSGVFLLLLTAVALIRAETPVVSSELPAITLFLSKTVNHPVEIQSLELRWRRGLPVLVLKGICILGVNPCEINEVKLGFHFILLDGLRINSNNNLNMNNNNNHYFKHIIFKNTVIDFNKYHFVISYLSLKKHHPDRWSWRGRDISLGLDKLFLAPLLLDKTSGIAVLDVQPDGWKIAATNIIAENSALALTANLSVEKRADETSPVINLVSQYEFNNNLAKNIKNYLPQPVLDKNLKNWLVDSIRSVEAGDGKLILNGKLSDFPYDKAPGEFLIDAQLKNVNLQYDKNWPMVSDLNGELIFSGHEMHMDIYSGVLDGIEVQHATASIPVLGKASVLMINTNTVSTDMIPALLFIHNSPLDKTLGQKLKGLSWSGPIILGLKLAIPLNNNRVKVQGGLVLNNNALSIPAWKINLTELSGKINFTQHDFLTPQYLTGLYLKTPVSIKINKNTDKHKFIINYVKNSIILNPNNNGFYIAVNSPDIIGNFTVSPELIMGAVKKITLKSNAVSDFNTVMPSKIPALRLAIHDFNYNKMNMGGIILRTYPKSDGLLLKYIKINNPDNHYSIISKGTWLNQGGLIIAGNINSTDLSKTMQGFGLPANIQGNAGNIGFNINWRGDLNNLSGQLKLNIGKGQLVTSGSQAQMDFGRLLTLLSFQSLTRRLTLDFTDLTQKGLSFDSITGDFTIKKGYIYIPQMKIKGPVADINMNGNTDFIHEIYHLNFSVTPHLISSVPIIAALAGGPVVGAAAWAGSKIVTPILDHVTTYHYTVTGTWNHPVIKRE